MTIRPTRERGGATAAPATAGPSTTTRTRTRTPATTRKPKEASNAEDGELADELNRVLQISQPKVPTSRRAVASSSAAAPTKAALPPVRAVKTVAKASSSANLRAGSSSKDAVGASSSVVSTPRPRAAATTKKPQERPATSQAEAGPSRLPATKPPTARPRSPLRPKTRPPPSALALPEWATDESMPKAEKGKAATKAINTANTTLGLAVRAGFRLGRPVEADGEKWSDDRVAGLVAQCRLGIQVMRGLNDGGEINSMWIGVEKVALSLVQRCFGMSMFEVGLDILAESRERISRLYPAQDLDRPKRTMTTDELIKALPEEWAKLLEMAHPTQMESMAESARMMIFQFAIYTWICFFGVRPKYKLRLSSLFGTSPSLPSTPPSLNSLHLAINLPQNLTVPLLNIFGRQVSSIPTSSSEWPLAARLALSVQALATSLSPSPEAKTISPKELWAQTHTQLYARLQESIDDAPVVAGILQDVVIWVEHIVGQRKEDAKAWFGGKAWMELLDLWISIGRRLGDSGIIDEALSRMTGSTRITQLDPGGPSTPRSSTPPSELSRPTPARSGSSRRAVQRISDAEEAVYTYCGEMAATCILLDKVRESPQEDIIAASAQSALSNFPLLPLSDALISLTDSDAGKAAFEKAARRLESVRRACEKLSAGAKGKVSIDGIGAAVHVWLVGEVDLIEDFVQGSPMDLSSVTSTLAPLASGAINSLITFFCHSASNPSSPQAPLVYLDRIHRLTVLCRPIIPPLDYVEWIRCSTQHAHNHAITLYRAERFADALPYARLAADRVVDMAEYLNVEEMNTGEKKEKVEGLMECLSGRWDTVGRIAFQVQDYPLMLHANTAALSNIPRQVLERLLSQAATLQYPALWQSLSSLDSLIRHLVAPILNNPSQAAGMTNRLFSMALRLTGTEGELAKMMLLERWFEALGRGLQNPDIVVEAMRVGEAVLRGLSAAVVPVRRMRFICRLLGTMLQTGAKAEDVPALLDELDQLCQVQQLGQDTGLAPAVPEYRATALLLRALFTYRLGGADSTAAVSAIAGKAMDELRRIILPPSTPIKVHASPIAPSRTVRPKQPLGRATTTPAPRPAIAAKSRTVSETKTPKRSTATADLRKVSETTPPSPQSSSPEFADLPRLISLLTSLVSLLGLLALPLQKIEGLKLARALMRSNESMVGEYITLSARLGTEYARLGKWGRATAVFGQAKRCGEGRVGVEDERRAEWGLRYAGVLAQMGKVEEARKEYEDAYALHVGLQNVNPTSLGGRAVVTALERAGKYERAALARVAFAAILVAEGKTALILPHLAASYRLYTRYVEFIAGLGPEIKPASAEVKAVEDDPFAAPAVKSTNGVAGGASAKDALMEKYPSMAVLDNRLLSGIQWHATEAFLGSIFDMASAYALRGTATDVRYCLIQAKQVAEIVRAPLIVARSEARLAELEGRLRNYEASSGRLEVAGAIFVNSDGPDAVESRIIHGDLLEKQESAKEALKFFERGGEDIEGLEEGFGKKEALLPTPERPAGASKVVAVAGQKDRLLPSTLAHVLRQRLWLGRKEGMGEVERTELVRQIQALGSSASERAAEELFLNGRLALLEVLKVFKTDLFMSSLTDSTIAMPMSTLTRRSQDRHSTRRTVNSLLAKSAAAFHSALELMEQDGRVEDVRQAGMSLALLHAFQTSLGEGGESLASAAADLLASTSSITMRREMVDVIGAKFVDGPQDDITWPTSGSKSSRSLGTDDGSDDDQPLRNAWSSISARLQSPSLTAASPIDLSPLPANWAVVSISVAADHSTMFLSRHQRDHDPLVLCLPLDRQGKREGEDNPLPFQLALDELRDIVETSDTQARVAKDVVTPAKRQEWWEARHALDTRLGELITGMEENWLGAFKSILKPQSSVTPRTIQSLRSKMEKIFNEALAGIGTDMRKVKTVRLDDAVLACFATLDGTTREEEVEDLVYFVLDFYGFHGIPVAIAELDIDQIGVDVKQALHEIAISSPPLSSSQPEHLLLALDKNVQDFPWESMPVLRGKPVSRIPSLPFLLNHLELARLTSPEKNGMLSVNARKVFYVLNPSGDLSRTQTHFEPWLEQMKERAGWKGIVGRPPTNLELENALRENDLVLYFGHGGAEHYIRSKSVRKLPNCATTFLWGCSSGLLKDQGDLDRAGTAWDYMMGGCPSLIANLWDVTDRDIDRLSSEVHKKLGLDASHIGRSLVPATTSKRSGLALHLGKTKSISTETPLLPLSGMSTVQALNASRDECRLKYLTGAAPVVYGLPVWMF